MENKKLILDYSTWRCGYNGPNKLGIGYTQLLNKEGYMCCLGQFSLQLNDLLDKGMIIGGLAPESLNVVIPDLSSELEDGEGGQIRDTNLSESAMMINDDTATTPDQKINMLRELFSKYSYEIEVINHRVEVECPVCKQKFKLNNPERIPDHRIGWRSANYWFSRGTPCKGAWSKQKSENTSVEIVYSMNSAIGTLVPGDVLLVDFSRDIWQQVYKGYTDITECKIIGLKRINILCNDGSVWGSWIEVTFDNIPVPVNDKNALLYHCIKL